jgi:uncharacterized protein
LTLGFSDGHTETLAYDTSESVLFRDGKPLVFNEIPNPEKQRDGMLWEKPPEMRACGRHDWGRLQCVRIKLGAACNYRCGYCVQASMKLDEDGTVSDVTAFLKDLAWVRSDPDDDGAGLRFELFGGEPLVYWDALRLLIEGLRARFPKASLFMPTNGSLITKDKVDFFEAHDVYVSVSHDGPGQFVRGGDPLAEPGTRECILDLYRRMHPKGLFRFAAVANKKNMRRRAILDYFVALTGNPAIEIGETVILEPHDPGGIALSPDDQEEYRRISFLELSENNFELLDHFPKIRHGVLEFISSLTNRRKLENIGSRCSVENPKRVVVDLKGNVLICNNKGIADLDRTGETCRAGKLARREEVRINPRLSQHRKKCEHCPVAQACKGGCVAPARVPGVRRQLCENFYSDGVVKLSLALLMLTGGVLTRIDGEFPDARKDVFGLSEDRRQRTED